MKTFTERSAGSPTAQRLLERLPEEGRQAR